MKRLLILIVLVLTGCGDSEPEQAATKQDPIREIISQVNTSGTITDRQAESLGKAEDRLYLNGLTTITDKQTESLSKAVNLQLNGLTSITDQQAESLSKIRSVRLSGLTTITDEQAKSLSGVSDLYLNGLTAITDAQACLLYTSPSPRDRQKSRMPSSA